MSKAFSAFYDYLLPELPGCTPGYLDLQLLQVARELCTRAQCWRDTFPAIASQDATLTYFLVTPAAKTELVRPLTLTVNDLLLWAAEDPQECDENQPKYRSDEPPFSIDAAGTQVTLTEQPTGDIVLTGAIRPTLAATSLPDFLLTDLVDTLRAGVLSRLLVMQRKHWSNPGLGAFYMGEYTRLTHVAASKARHGNTRRPLRTRIWG